MAFDNRLRYDGVETYLATQLAAGTNVVSFANSLTMDGGVPVPTIARDSGDYLVLTILDENYILKEIVYLVDYTSGASTGVVERGMEGTSSGHNHPQGVKVVHAPTAEDFISVQDHDQDPNAHHDAMLAIAQSEASKAITAHKLESDPHTQYLLRTDTSFDDGITVPDGATLAVESGATLHIKEGATLLVDGTLSISNIGRLLINGKQLVISNTEPTAPVANMVWIKTFGA